MLTAILLAFGAGAAAGQTSEDPPRARIKKVSRPMVWQPGPEGNQVPLWPDGLALLKPDTSKPEEVGNGSRMVAGRPWHWAGYVSRPTMTIYPPKGRNTRAAMLVDRKSTRLNSSHLVISYAVFCLKKKTYPRQRHTTGTTPP